MNFTFLLNGTLSRSKYSIINKHLHLLPVKKFSSSVQFFYNASNYNTDFGIKLPGCGSQFFTMEFYKGLLGK